MDRGTYLEYDGRPAVRFQRSYPYPLQRLWAAVTEPDELKHWFPFRVSMQPRQTSEDENLAGPRGPGGSRRRIGPVVGRGCSHRGRGRL